MNNTVDLLNFFTFTLQLVVALCTYFVQFKYFTVMSLLLIPQFIFLALHLCLLISLLQSNKISLTDSFLDKKSALAPFMPTIKLAMTLNFTMVILQPLYLIGIEVYEYQTQKQFYYEQSDNNSFDYSLITDIVTVILIYAPSLINFIAAVSLIGN